MKETTSEKSDIVPGTESRSDVLWETPEEKEKRVERDISLGLRQAPPEQIDQTKSTVTQEQVQAQAEAAPQPYQPAKESGKNAPKATHKKTNH